MAHPKGNGVVTFEDPFEKDCTIGISDEIWCDEDGSGSRNSRPPVSPVFHLWNGLWLGAESNRRHVDFQSTALPTELPSRDWPRTCRSPWDFHYAATWL